MVLVWTPSTVWGSSPPPVTCFRTVTARPSGSQDHLPVPQVSLGTSPAPLHGVAQLRGSHPTLFWGRLSCDVSGWLLGVPGAWWPNGGVLRSHGSPILLVSSGPEGPPWAPPQGAGLCSAFTGSWKTFLHHAEKKEDCFLPLWDDYENLRQVIAS